jgi:hypothetical protein
MRGLPLAPNGMPLTVTSTRGVLGKKDPVYESRLARSRICVSCGQPLEGDYNLICYPDDGQESFPRRDWGSGEGPMHRECAEYALRVCPALTAVRDVMYDGDDYHVLVRVSSFRVVASELFRRFQARPGSKQTIVAWWQYGHPSAAPTASDWEERRPLREPPGDEPKQRTSTPPRGAPDF